MRKGLQVAIAVEIAVLVGAFAYLFAFLNMNVGHDRPLLNVVLVLVGVLAAGGLLATLWQRTLEREALIRRFFVSNNWIYNHEIGFAPVSQIVPDRDVYDFVTFAADALSRMSYGFDVANPPEVFKPAVVIDSYVFHFHEADEEGIVVDEWQGVVREIVDNTGTESDFRTISRFANAGELASLLEDIEVIHEDQEMEADD